MKSTRLILIGTVLMVLTAGVASAADANYLDLTPRLEKWFHADGAKCADLRIFNDDADKMNLSVRDVGGGLLAVSQFTLYGDSRKGRRPSFVASAPAERAQALYARFLDILAETGLPVAAGVFQAKMAVELVNDGPVTMIIDRDAGEGS